MYSLYYYDEIGQLKQIIDSIDFIDKEIWVQDVDGVYRSLFDTLSEDQKEHVYLTPTKEHKKLVKYQDYYTISSVLLDYDSYNVNNGLFIRNVQTNVLKQVNYIKINFPKSEEQTPYLWIYNATEGYMQKDELEMLVEAFTQYGSQLIVSFIGYGEEIIDKATIELIVQAKVKNLSQILWYRENGVDYYLNEYFLHDGADITLEPKYNKHLAYYFNHTSRGLENILDLITINKSEIFYKHDIDGLVRVLEEIILPIDIQYYIKLPQNYMSLTTISDDVLRQLYYNDNYSYKKYFSEHKKSPQLSLVKLELRSSFYFFFFFEFENCF